MERPPNIYPLTGLQIGEIRRNPSSSFLYTASESKRLLILVEEEDLLVFEVAWKDVCGIKYMNELQADASISLEARSMQKWKFDGPETASRCASSWFSGTDSEVEKLKNCLRFVTELRSSSESLPGVPNEDDDEQTSSSGTDDRPQENKGSGENATKYNRAFILFRFSDDKLTADLRKTVVDERRLYRLLESGIPSWAIFFQSHSPFSQCYRSWMRHLVRTIHGLILLVSFAIAFYDLYRNIPLIKADLSRIFGLVFRWTGACKSHLSQNFEKTVKWLLMTAALLAEPLAAAGMGIVPAPFWTTLKAISSAFQVVVGVLIWPFELISFVAGRTALLIRLTFITAWEIILPVRLVLRSLKLAFFRRICGLFFQWLEVSEVFRFPYLGTMFLLQNFEKAVEWFLGTVRLLAETLPSVGPFRNTFARMTVLIPWDTYLDLMSNYLENTSSCVAAIGKLIGEEVAEAWELLLPLFQSLWPSLKLSASAARGLLPNFGTLLPSLTAGGGRGRGHRWRDLRGEFRSWEVLGRVKTVASGLFAFLLTCKRRYSQSLCNIEEASCRLPAEPPSASPEHGYRCEGEPGASAG